MLLGNVGGAEWYRYLPVLWVVLPEGMLPGLFWWMTAVLL
jgi:hypothetical protein